MRKMKLGSKLSMAERILKVLQQDYKTEEYTFILDELASEIDQDWKNETTVYTFSDNSILWLTGNEIGTGVK